MVDTIIAIILTLVISVIITFHIFGALSNRAEIKSKEREDEFLERYQKIYGIKDREEEL